MFVSAWLSPRSRNTSQISKGVHSLVGGAARGARFGRVPQGSHYSFQKKITRKSHFDLPVVVFSFLGVHGAVRFLLGDSSVVGLGSSVTSDWGGQLPLFLLESCSFSTGHVEGSFLQTLDWRIGGSYFHSLLWSHARFLSGHVEGRIVRILNGGLGGCTSTLRSRSSSLLLIGRHAKEALCKI